MREICRKREDLLGFTAALLNGARVNPATNS
jgi:hypothetical protein